MRCCKTCAMFYPCKTLKEWESGAEPDMGECRRFPPSFTNPDAHEVDFFPTVDAEFWCGEYSEGSYEERGFE